MQSRLMIYFLSLSQASNVAKKSWLIKNSPRGPLNIYQQVTTSFFFGLNSQKRNFRALAEP